MKKLILLTICTILLLTGCGQAAAPEVDTVPAIVQEETTMKSTYRRTQHRKGRW